MHGKLTCALLGRSLGDSNTRYALGLHDWDSDRKGHTTVNYDRFLDCYFTLADRFTSEISGTQSAMFLDRLLSHILMVGIGGRVKFKSDEQVLQLSDVDPLLNEDKGQWCLLVIKF